MKRIITILLTILILFALSACGSNDTDKDSINKSSSPSLGNTVSSNSQSSNASSSTSSISTSKDSSNNESAAVFTNKYGTATTKCAHSGCNNYIASSGDTNCCATHSNRCLRCSKYIDEDATYCIDCIAVVTETAQSNSNSVSGKSSSGSSTTSTVFTNKYGTATTKCAHSGCNNYIASSGDTNCCTTHSNRCLRCGKYIDEDATYCIDCIAAVLGG